MVGGKMEACDSTVVPEPSWCQRLVQKWLFVPCIWERYWNESKIKVFVSPLLYRYSVFITITQWMQKACLGQAVHRMEKVLIPATGSSFISESMISSNCEVFQEAYRLWSNIQITGRVLLSTSVWFLANGLQDHRGFFLLCLSHILICWSRSGDELILNKG